MTFFQKRRLHKVKRILKKMLLYVSFSLMSFALIFCLGFNAFCVQDAMADAVNGGGLYVGKSSTLNYEGKRNLSGFIASSNGGGIYNIGTLNINGGTISANKAVSGGGVYSDGSFKMNGGTISDNEASNGGGIYGYSNGSLTVNDGSISGNKATSNGGGGIYLDGCYLDFENGSVTGNTSSNYGGGIYVTNSAEVMFINGSISGNSAKFGGGIYIDSGLFTLGGGTVSGNTAKSGAGVYVKSKFVMKGGTVVNNTSTVSDYNIYAYRNSEVYLLKGTANGVIGGNGTIYFERAFDFDGTYNLKSYGSLVLEDYNGTTPKLNLVVEEREGTFLTFQGSTTTPNMSNITISGYDSNSYEITKTLSGTTWTFTMSKKVIPGLFTKTWRDEVSSILSLSSFDNVERIQFRYQDSVELQGSDFYCPHKTSYSQYGIMTTGIKVFSCQNKDCIIFVYDKPIIADIDMEQCFAGLVNVESMIFENFDTSKTVIMTAMFYNCIKLTRLDLSGFNTEKVCFFGGMFDACNGLQSLDISNFVILKRNKYAGSIESVKTNMMLNFGATYLQYFYTPKYVASSHTIPISSSEISFFDAIDTYTNLQTGAVTSYSTLPDYHTGSRTLVKTQKTFSQGDSSLVEDNMNLYVNDKIKACVGVYNKVHLKFAFEAPDFYHGETDGTGGVKIYEHISNGNMEICVVYDNLLPIKNAEGLFSAKQNPMAEYISTFNFQNFWTSMTQSMAGMFFGTTYLEHIYGLQNFQTENLRTMGSMFEASGIQELNFYKMNLINVDTTEKMFRYCMKLESLNMSNIEFATLVNTTDMFTLTPDSDNPSALIFFAAPQQNATEIQLVNTIQLYDESGNEMNVIPAGTHQLILTDGSGYVPDYGIFDGFFAPQSNNSKISSNLEKLDLWAGYSALTFVYVSAIAYPGIEWKRRKEKNIKK